MKRTYGVTRAASGIGATTAAPGQRALGRSGGVSPPLGDDALAFVPDVDRERTSRCAVGNVRRAGVASRSPALPPRARVPVPRCSEVSQPGLPSCLVGCKVILDEGVDDESVCRRSDGGDRKAAGATSG
jgi:hypothetical protein